MGVKDFIKSPYVAYITLIISMFSLFAQKKIVLTYPWLDAILAVILIYGGYLTSELCEREQKPGYVIIFAFIILFGLGTYWGFGDTIISRRFPYSKVGPLDTSSFDLVKERLAYIKSSYEMFISWAVIILGAVTVVFRENFFPFNSKQKEAVRKNIHLLFLIWIPFIYSLYSGTKTNEIIVQSLKDKKEIMDLACFQTVWSLQKEYFLMGFTAIGIYLIKVLRGGPNPCGQKTRGE